MEMGIGTGVEMAGVSLRPKQRPLAQHGSSEGDIRKAMQQVLGRPEVAFKSPQQERAMHAILRGQTPLVVVLPTGGGKSLLFTVPACMPNPGVTIVVVPFRALIGDMLERIRGAGVECMEWKYEDRSPASIVVVSADIAGGSSFLTYALTMQGSGLLRRVVVDECHLVITSSDWRPKLAKIKNLRILRCPIVLLTATLPPVLEDVLAEDMNISLATYIRASTVRPNTRYAVTVHPPRSLEKDVLEVCRRAARRMARGGKGIVYSKSKV